MTVVAACLLAASCMMVDDFDACWEKGTIDPAVAGTWRKIPVPGIPLEASPGPPTVTFTKEDTSYAVRTSEGSWVFRTLRIGPHAFFMARGEGKPDGMLQRYEVRNDVLRLYTPENDAIMRFIETKHPATPNITRNLREGRYVIIKTLDAEVFSVLAEIAADAKFWTPTSQFQRQ